MSASTCQALPHASRGFASLLIVFDRVDYRNGLTNMQARHEPGSRRRAAQAPMIRAAANSFSIVPVIAPAPGSPDGIWISLQNTREIAGTKTGTAARPTKSYNRNRGSCPWPATGLPSRGWPTRRSRKTPAGGDSSTQYRSCNEWTISVDGLRCRPCMNSGLGALQMTS